MKTNNRLEINDLIEDAVTNALARRTEAVESVSDEEAKNIAGGLASKAIICGRRPIITGKIITIGLIATETDIA